MITAADHLGGLVRRPGRPGQRRRGARHRALAHARRRPGPGAAGRPGRARPAAAGARRRPARSPGSPTPTGADAHRRSRRSTRERARHRPDHRRPATLGNVLDLASSPDGGQARRRPRRRPAAARRRRRRARSRELAAQRRRRRRGRRPGRPDSAWLAWSQPGPQPLRADQAGAGSTDGSIVDVTDGRFVDSHPVFTTRRAVPGVPVAPDLRPDLRRALLRPVVPARRPARTWCRWPRTRCRRSAR